MSSINQKRLRKMASELPELIEKVIVIRTGAEILEKAPDLKNSIGEDLIPEKKYNIEEVQVVDHLKNMKERYQKDGADGVGDYVAQVFQCFQECLNEIEDEKDETKVMDYIG